VNFNGTNAFSPNPSTSAIRSSYNVSSITKNGTGDYTVNFATALADTNYSVSLTAGGVGASDSTAWIKGSSTPDLMTVSALRITTGSSAVGTYINANNVHVQIFGN
jgi:hypothetical protein